MRQVECLCLVRLFSSDLIAALVVVENVYIASADKLWTHKVFRRCRLLELALVLKGVDATQGLDIRSDSLTRLRSLSSRMTWIFTKVVVSVEK